ncbi:MAG: hypothetical protein ABSH06_15310 [Thermodesulfobacteriota bacterium]|jgi:hypothetical protein
MAEEKVVGQSTRKPLRLTPMDKELAEGVRDLIRLYYVFKNNEPFIPVMKDFLKRIQGEDFEYKRETENPTKKLIKKGFISEGDYFVSICRLINFSHDQKVWFVKIMDLLLESIKERTVDHFYAVKWVHKTVTDMSDGELKVLTPDVIIQEGSSENRVVGALRKLERQSQLYPIKGSKKRVYVTQKCSSENRSVPEKLIHKQVVEALRKQERQSQLYPIKGSKKRVYVTTVPYKVYEVRSNTDFGVTLLRGESIIYDLEHQTWEDNPLPKGLSYTEIPPINLVRGWRYFLQIVRSLLVNYHIAFGNFEYIKTCEYNPCNKLFVEKRAGRGRFCSEKCQRKFKQASEKYKCMNRQNTWIRRKLPKIKKEVDALRFKHGDIRAYNPSPEHVSEGACKRCDTCMKSGKCAALIKNNKKVLSIQKELPVIQKELLNPLIKKKDVVIKLNRLLRNSD